MDGHMLLTVTTLPPILDIAAPKGEGIAGADAFAPLIAALTVSPADGKTLPPPGQPMPVAARGNPIPLVPEQPETPMDAVTPPPPLDAPGMVGKPGAATPNLWPGTLQLAPTTVVAAPAQLLSFPAPAQTLDGPGQSLRALPDGGSCATSQPAQDRPGKPVATATPDPSREIAPAIASLSPPLSALPTQPMASPAGAAAAAPAERPSVTPLSSTGRARAAKLSERAHDDNAAGAVGRTEPDAALVTLAPNLQPVQATDQAVVPSAGRFTPLPAAAPGAAFAATVAAISPAFARSAAPGTPTIAAGRRATATLGPPGSTTTGAAGPAPTGTSDPTTMPATDHDADTRSGSSSASQPRPVVTASTSAPLTLVAGPAALPSLPTEPVAAAGDWPTASAAALPTLLTAAPVAPSPAPVIVPALQAFGAAMRQALADERRPARRLAEPTGIAPTLAATATAGTAAVTTAPLDTADARWPQAMVQHIERLRDAADAASTRIRLLPDALGPVDVSVRRDGDAVHVHLAAPFAETRQLLQDAQPRLTEAAEQRGLKLIRAEVSAGSSDAGGGGDRQSPPAPAPFIRTPRSAPAPATAENADETRIA